SLTVSKAATTTAAAGATASFNTTAQNVNLNATVTSPAGTVNEGTVTFTILNGNTVIGAPVTANVANGAVSATYTLPGGTHWDIVYTIKAVYSTGPDYTDSQDANHSLTMIPGLDPVLSPIGSKSVAQGQTVTFTALATDPNLPASPLAFSLD